MATVARLPRALSGVRRAARFPSARGYATMPAKPHHRVVIVGGGTAGVTVAAQLTRSQLDKPDIAILDPASTHHYQVRPSPATVPVPPTPRDILSVSVSAP